MKNKIELCDSCGKNPANELNTCPYDYEFQEGGEILDECNCCDDCRLECLYNI